MKTMNLFMVLVLAGLVLGLSTAQAAPLEPYLVKDIYPWGDDSRPRHFTAWNDVLFFQAMDGTNGMELWKSDGTEAGTVMVKDIWPGSLNSFPFGFTDVNGTLFFMAKDGTHGIELWKTDGTEAGTVLVKDIYPGGVSSSPQRLKDVNGTLFFVANDGINGKEAWRSDGTEAGTVMVKDINPGGGNSGLVFLTDVNSTIFFRADDGTNGAELWKSDGTEAGTVMVKDINPGGDSSPSALSVGVDGTLFFSANDGTHGAELWKSDGTEAGTVMVRDITWGIGSSWIGPFINVDGTLFFNVSNRLWKSDGTAAGTLPVYGDLRLTLYPTEMNGTIYFAGDGFFTGRELWALAVSNQPPTADTGGPYTVSEGSTVTLDGTASSDPDGDPLTFVWDLDNDGAFETPGDSVIFSAVGFDGPKTHTVALQVCDTSSQCNISATTVNVINAVPTVNAGPDQTTNEGDTVSFGGSFTDPGSLDTHTYSWDLGDGNTAEGTLNPSHVYADNGVYAVTLTVADDDGGVGTDSLMVTVNNVAPTVGAITAPVDPVQVNTNVDASASFTDPGVLDTHTAVWDWGDGSTSSGIVNETNGSGFVSGSHTYATAGVYTVTLTVTDDDGTSATSVFQYIVVYDPEGAFVTGSGWINSPAGAYAPDPLLTGKAHFGFVSRYQEGATVPTGQTSFQFHLADLNFHSTSYQWLVVAGARARFKGDGTINGVGNYGFMITAVDAALTPSTDGDLFRIKIWDKDNGDAIVYDNQMGAANDADPTTAINGGSIVIH